MKSVMQHNFGQTPQAEIPRSSFNRSHGVKTTFDSSYLIPIFVDEALPGDTFNLRTSGFTRMATPLYPVMDNLFLETFYFSIPIRLVWDNFVKMMGEQANPSDSIDYEVPTMTSPAGGYGEMSLSDYLGIPTKVASLEHSSLFHRAANLVWNEWFRDQDLQDSLTVDKDDGPDNPTDYVLQRRGKRHDYFTAARPWPLKGGVDVTIPLGTDAPITGFGFKTSSSWAGATSVNETDGIGSVSYTNHATSSALIMEQDPNNLGYPNVRADLTNATSATINQLRLAFQTQKLFERDARSGSRYPEMIMSHFNVYDPQYAVLQRPEFLGGGSDRINVTPIAQTSNDGTNGSVGQLGGMAVSAFNGHGFTKSFTEHCIILGFANVRADLTYQQGLNRMFSRQDRLDFFLPVLSGLGEQAILNKEIYADASANDENVFGYIPRWDEYRYKPSTIHGQFRSNSTTPLDAWHLSQEFGSLPTLGSTFIEDNPPVSRVVATPSEPEFIGDFYHDLTCVRPMPMFGIPGNIDRF